MKINFFVIVVFGFFLIPLLAVQSQTLYNGVGHIPGYYQETWNVAGLVQDMSTIEPKLVIQMSPGACSPWESFPG